MSGQASDVDSSQHPHSTEKESGQTHKYVTSQLQSLLQQHLQRNTALRSIQQQQQQRAALSAGNPSDNLSTTTAIPQLMPSIVPIMAMPPSLIPMPQPHTQQVHWSGLVIQYTGLRPCQSVHRLDPHATSPHPAGMLA